MVSIYAEMVLLDGKTFNVIAASPLAIKFKGDGTMGSRSDHNLPIELLEGFEWKDKWLMMTDEQHELIHTRFKSLLIDSVSFTIARMKII